MQTNSDVVGIFAENDEMALGAVQALGDRAGDDVFIVDFDATDDGQAAVSEGPMYATIAPQPAELGRAAVEAAIAMLDGEGVDDTIAVPVVALRQDDI